jgi:hypothetical protein
MHLMSLDGCAVSDHDDLPFLFAGSGEGAGVRQVLLLYIPNLRTALKVRSWVL